ncbi:MAG: DUF3047 domain-containing protein [Pontibacterium sp.]
MSVFASSLIYGQTVEVGRFFVDNADVQAPAPWQLLRFDEAVPATVFRVISWQGVSALEAVSEKSMALLARPLDVNLKQTPVLCWRWWIDQTVEQADMNSKQGDDYAARVYVTFDLPDQALGFGTRLKLALARGLFGQDVPEAALNYVWDNQYPVGTEQANAYTNRAMMRVQRSGNQQAGQWVSERRNVMKDFMRLFNVPGAQAVQLAVTADSDNTGGSARALFADLHFVSERDTCHWSG